MLFTIFYLALHVLFGALPTSHHVARSWDTFLLPCHHWDDETLHQKCDPCGWYGCLIGGGRHNCCRREGASLRERHTEEGGKKVVPPTRGNGAGGTTLAYQC
jgi:hypothetical protein